MRRTFSLILILTLIACSKDKTEGYDYKVKVEDYYSANPIKEQSVVLLFCEGGGMGSGPPPCDSVDAKFTNQRGVVKFSGTYTSGWGNGHEIVIRNGNGYPRTRGEKIKESVFTSTIRVKPLVLTDFRLRSSITIDSLTVRTDVGAYGVLGYLHLNFKDSVAIPLQTIPGELNAIGVSAYRNDTLVGRSNIEYTPVYGADNVLYFEFN